jgi:SAM-dependent methyltransferase
MTSSQYDSIVSEYDALHDDLQSYPCGQLEEANLHAAVKDHIRDKRVLDLGCGSGHYTRRLLEWGASSVVGVDLSEGMVEEARSRIRGDEEGRLQYVVGDVSNGLDLQGPFDVIVGTWLLNYASSARDMEGMWRSIAANLRPGGLFFGLTIPPPRGNEEELNRALREDWAPFGTAGYVAGIVDDGFAVHIALGMPEGGKKAEFENFYLRNEVFEASCRAAKIERGLEWLPLVLPERLKEKFPSGYWNRLVLNPHFRICCAKR